MFIARARGAALGDALLPVVQAMARPWFLTLTVKNGPDLPERAAHLRVAFKKLGRRAWWKANVVGGIAVEAVSHNAPHLVTTAFTDSAPDGGKVIPETLDVNHNPLRAAMSVAGDAMAAAQMVAGELLACGASGVKMPCSSGLANSVARQSMYTVSHRVPPMR